MLKLPLAALAALALAGSAVAQESPDNAGTTALNTAVAAHTDTRAALNAEAQAQYDADVDAWRKAVVRTARQKSADEAWYANQSASYADAMYAWRLQVAACKRGNVKQCRYPSPDPADFY